MFELNSRACSTRSNASVSEGWEQQKSSCIIRPPHAGFGSEFSRPAQRFCVLDDDCRGSDRRVALSWMMIVAMSCPCLGWTSPLSLAAAYTAKILDFFPCSPVLVYRIHMHKQWVDSLSLVIPYHVALLGHGTAQANCQRGYYVRRREGGKVSEEHKS